MPLQKICWRKYQSCTASVDWSGLQWCSESEWSCRSFYIILDVLFCDPLRTKHPPAQLLWWECLLSTMDTRAVHQVVFDALGASVVCAAAALHTVGAAGPSGIDAHGWRSLRLHFFICTASDKPCGAIILLARWLCTTFLSVDILSPLSACQFIALDKSLEVYPIEVCEVVWCIATRVETGSVPLTWMTHWPG